MKMRENKMIPNSSDYSPRAYQCLFEPESIVVIGASNDRFKPGGRAIANIKENNYTGRLWAVNPKTADVMGLPTYKTITDLPSAPDLAILAVPSGFVPAAIDELAALGAGAAMVFTSGFGEKDDAGKQTEQHMRETAEKAGMALIGPNCSGFLTPVYKGKFAGIIPTLSGGAVDLISGSGATVDYIMESATTRGLSFGTVVNLGNSAMLGVEDIVALYDENYGPHCASILMLYMESLKKPATLLRHARSLIQKGCSLVGIKSGVTDAGRRAAASHTGAMATRDAAVGALFEKSGIIRVNSKTAMIDVACVLSALPEGGFKGRRACVITDAGGPGVMLSDELSRCGWDLPPLKQTTMDRLGDVMPPEGAFANPIDCLPTRNAAMIRNVFNILFEEEKDRLDVIAVITGDSGMADNGEIYDEISRAIENGPISVLPVLSSVITSRKAIRRFVEGGRSYFIDEVSAGTALGHVAACMTPEETSDVPEGYDTSAIAGVLEGQTGALNPDTTARLFSAAGFPLPPQIEVFQEKDLAAGCRQIGYPLVMKVIGPLHKTDLNGVRLNITDDQEAAEAWNDLMAIRDSRGALLQPMVTGPEVILGVGGEGDFGHLVMFGLGGIYAEALKDITFGLAPLTLKEARRMIDGIRGHAIVEGTRGQAGMDLDLLADMITRLGKLVADFPQIEEIDLNPVKGVGKNLYAVDARIIVA
jgi:acetyltransferase